MQRILDKHVPLKSWTRHVGQNDCCWLLAEARDAKRCCRRHERRYRRTKSTSDRPEFHASRRTAREAITRSKCDAIRQRFNDVSDNSAATWRVVREQLHRHHRPVHTDSQCRTLANGFSRYFSDKLERIHQSIACSQPAADHRTSVPWPPTHRPSTADEVRKVLTTTRLKQSPTDVLPTSDVAKPKSKRRQIPPSLSFPSLFSPCLLYTSPSPRD